MLISTIDRLNDRNIKSDLVSVEMMILIPSDYGLMMTFKLNHMSRWTIKPLEKVVLSIRRSRKLQQSLTCDAWKYGESETKRIYKPNSITERMKEGSKQFKIFKRYSESLSNLCMFLWGRIEKMRKVDKKALWDNGFNQSMMFGKEKNRDKQK